uniref:Condensin-2 complex subunit D3 n=1 Tax=Callorhinchus milii TaxID=7868 RepID=V9K7T1_CALMI
MAGTSSSSSSAALRLLQRLEGLKLRQVSAVWVDTVWELDFTETEPLDSHLEEEIIEDGLEVFSQLHKSLLKFISQDQESAGGIWTLFAENDIHHNVLVAVLYHFVHMIHDKNAGVAQREYALHAAELYFLLLEIPGSVANRLFHPVLFDKCLDTLTRSWPMDVEKNRKRKKDTQVKSSQHEAKGRKRSKPARQTESQMDDIFEEEEEDAHVHFSVNDLCRIRDSIFSVLKNFLRFLSKFSLKDNPHCAHHCLQVFSQLTSFEPVIGGLSFSKAVNIERMRTMPELSYYGLRLLCSPMHGDVNKLLCSLFETLLNTILMIRCEEGSKSIVLLGVGQKIVLAKDVAIKFISYIVDELKEPALPTLRILLQHICAKVPDKLEYRSCAAQSVVQLLKKLPSADYATFLDWLFKYSQNSKISYRAFALDVVMALLDLPEREPDDTVPQEHHKYLMHKYWLQVLILGRCSDKAPTVRSRALTCLAQCLNLGFSSAVDSIHELVLGTTRPTMFHSQSEGMLDIQKTCATGGEAVTDQQTSLNAIKYDEFTEGNSVVSNATTNQFRNLGTLKSIEITDLWDSSVTDVKDVMSMLRSRAGDERSNVRKSALQVFVSILKHNLVNCKEKDLSILEDRCRDPALSVRKQALQSITELLLVQPSNPLLQKAWLNGVIPVVIDSECSVQEKVLECLDRVIVQQIKHYNMFSDQDKHQRLAWDVLALLTLENHELCRYLTKAFHLWSYQNKFNSTFIKNLISHTDMEHAPAAWMLLSKVVGSSTNLNYGKIIETWDNIYRSKKIDESTSNVFRVIGHIAQHLPEETRTQLIDDVQNWINAFCFPPEIISPAVEALGKLCQPQCNSSAETQVLMNQICGKLISACESYISKIVLTEAGAECLDENVVVRYLFTLGEVAQLCPAKIEKRIFLLVQSFLAASRSLTQAGGPEGGDLLASQPLSQFAGSTMPPVIRAHAFVTLGKLCLQHEDLAKKCIAALARELDVCEDVAVRNNVIIVMCDLCVRYTTMVDRYIPNIAVCLKDESPFIRKQTLIMLTNLLQEEFVKWKGSLFFRFVSVLVDSDESIARFAKFCLVHLLLKRNPLMFSQHFIECILHFNNYEKHEKYIISQTEREKKLFSLKGNANKENRMTIYKFLLEHFTDEQRFNLTTKIVHVILAYFVDGMLPLDTDASDLLSDIFSVMSCKEIKLSSTRSKPADEEPIDNDEMAKANAVMQVAQKKLISQVQKNNFVENIIPIVTCLKTQLQQKHIPALKDLMNYLREVMQDYRNELKDLFAADKQLAAELEYDMKKYEEQIAREEMERQNPTPAAEIRSPTQTPVQSPRGSAAQVGVGIQSTVGTRGAVSMLRTPQQMTSKLYAFVTPNSGVQNTPAATIPRRKSLSTMAILNSAKKAAQTGDKKHSKSIGWKVTTPPSENPVPKQQASFHSSGQYTRSGSSSSNSSLSGRAISTPDRTIDNLTFAAGVSYISPTPSEHGKEHSQKNVLCLKSPDKPAPQPQQWNVASPVAKTLNKPRVRKTPMRSSN